MRHIIDFSDITLDEWRTLYKRVQDILDNPIRYRDAAVGRIMASLFYEPSTRTRFSFHAAMQRLGGSVIGFADPASTSSAKGESLKDTIIMCSGYSDVVVVRHPCEGAAAASAMYARVPLVNAGDGGHYHPTQTLTDLTAIQRLRGDLCGLRVGICGDLKNGRTVHSLIRALARFEGISFYLISPRALAIPPYLRALLNEAKVPYWEVSGLDPIISQLDVLYMTRIQRERFDNPEEYERYRGIYILNKRRLAAAGRDLLILHPLPQIGRAHV